MTAASASSQTDALQIAKQVVGRARKLGLGARTELEAYVEFARTTTVRVFAGQPESVVTAEPRGLGVRVIQEGRVGYAYTADLSPIGMDKAVIEARDNAGVAAPDEAQALPRPPESYPVLENLWRPGVGTTSLDQKVSLALAAEAAALREPEVETVESSEYSDSEERVALASTRGIAVEGEQSSCFAYAFALAGKGEDRQAGLGFNLGREPADLDPNAIGSEAAAKARALVGAYPCPTGLYTVVFAREVAAALLAVIASALSADAIQKNRSVFQGKMSLQVGSELVTLWDDGLAEGGPSSRAFDAEGVPQQSTLLIDGGILRGSLHSTYTARKESAGAASTGNAVRSSYRVLPGVGASNLVLRPGQGELANLLLRTGSGFYVENVAGLHSGINPVSGEISLGATGRLIEGGLLGQPVREVTIATDFIGLLTSITDMAADARWIPFYGSVLAPSFAVAGVAVSGA